MPTVMVFAPVPQLTVTIEQHSGDNPELHVAVAAGALNVTRHGLGTGRHDAITELAARVGLTPISAG